MIATAANVGSLLLITLLGFGCIGQGLVSEHVAKQDREMGYRQENSTFWQRLANNLRPVIIGNHLKRMRMIWIGAFLVIFSVIVLVAKYLL